MIPDGLAIIALSCLASAELSPDEQKLVGSWQIELKSGERAITTFEPDHTLWEVALVQDKPQLRAAGRWHMSETALGFDCMQYTSISPFHRLRVGYSISEIKDQTLTLAQSLKYKRCERPEKPLEPALLPLPTPSPAPRHFFPDCAFSDDEEANRVASIGYSSGLEAFEEAPLFPVKPGSDVECYRFGWYRAFHRLVVLRIDVNRQGDATLTIKVADDDLYYGLKLVRNEKKQLDRFETEYIKASIEGSKFFELPLDHSEAGFDGSGWVIEAVANGRYHVVERWSPESGPVRQIGEKFIELAIGGDLMPIY